MSDPSGGNICGLGFDLGFLMNALNDVFGISRRDKSN
jgi:hypothetical protein